MLETEASRAPVEDLADVTAAILAGGMGTRLRPIVSDRPKVLAEVHGKPFLAHLLDQLAAAGVRNVVLCTGYLGEQVRSAFGDAYRDLRLTYLQETTPRGTAGALRSALALFESESVLALNGDSICEANLGSFRAWHSRRGAEGTIMLAETNDAGRCGRVVVNAAGRVLSFEEKQGQNGAAWVNAGIYLLDRRLIETIPATGSVSLEREIFPAWIARGLYGYRSSGRFLDIGTPAAYAGREQFFGS